MNATAKKSSKSSASSTSQGAQTRLSNGLNPMDAYLSGQAVAPVEREIKNGDRLTALHGKYLRGETTGARQGWTGPMVGRFLCALGYINLTGPNGTVIDAGTHRDEIPSHDDLYAAQSRLEIVKKLPTRSEFWKMVSDIRKESTGK